MSKAEEDDGTKLTFDEVRHVAEGLASRAEGLKESLNMTSASLARGLVNKSRQDALEPLARRLQACVDTTSSIIKRYTNSKGTTIVPREYQEGRCDEAVTLAFDGLEVHEQAELKTFTFDKHAEGKNSIASSQKPDNIVVVPRDDDKVDLIVFENKHLRLLGDDYLHLDHPLAKGDNPFSFFPTSELDNYVNYVWKTQLRIYVANIRRHGVRTIEPDKVNKIVPLVAVFVRPDVGRFALLNSFVGGHVHVMYNKETKVPKGEKSNRRYFLDADEEELWYRNLERIKDKLEPDARLVLPTPPKRPADEPADTAESGAASGTGASSLETPPDSGPRSRTGTRT